MVFILVVLILSGCGSVRYSSTLQPSGDKELRFGQARFSLIDFSTVYDKKNLGAETRMKNIDQDLVVTRAKTLYPNLFTDDWTGLPLMVKTDVVYDDTSSVTSAVLSALTVGIIPFPGVTKLSFTVATNARDALGDSLTDKDVKFVLEEGLWVSLLSPLGCIPVPGRADLPRDAILLFIPLTKDAYSKTKLPYFTADCIVEAMVQALRSVEPARIETAYQARQSRLQEVMIDGRHYWCFLAPTLTQNQEKAGLFTALLYQDYPKRGMKPWAQVTVARRDEAGVWHPVAGYLRSAKNLTTISALLENGVPAKVAVRVIEEPPLEDFIDNPGLFGSDAAANLRWSNGVLLEVKNRSLPMVLREKSRDELLSLITRIEKAILDLNEQAEQAKDRAQNKVEKGAGDPAPDRELAVLLRQRIEVLKPILTAIKQEATFRKP
jgi:hypothetical protein